jgi:integrase
LYAARKPGQPLKASFIARTCLGRPTIGPVDAWTVSNARSEALKHIEAAKVRNGRRNIRAEQLAAYRAERDAVRLGDLVESYLADVEQTLRPRSFTEVERHLRKVWKGLHKEPAFSLSRDQVIARLNQIEDESGPTAADRARTSLSTVFNWSLDRGFGIKANPAANISARAPSNGGRERTLTEAELRDVWLASDPEVAGHYGRVIRLLVLCGARRQEIGDLAWHEVVENGHAQIELPAERCKGNKAVIIPLSDLALSCLPPKVDGRQFVFARYDSATSGYSGWGRSKQQLDERILQNRRKLDPKAQPMKDWVVHDLRRTFCTLNHEKGFADADLIERIVGHARPGVGARYNRSERLQERRRALAKWGKYVASLVA